MCCCLQICNSVVNTVVMGLVLGNLPIHMYPLAVKISMVQKLQLDMPVHRNWQVYLTIPMVFPVKFSANGISYGAS